MTDTPTLNIPLLRKVVDFITEHPDNWRQATWLRLGQTVRNPKKDLCDLVQAPEVLLVPECGSYGCLAGWTCVLNGDTVLAYNGYDDASYVLTDDGETSIPQRARELLGINPGQGSRLFAGTWPERGQANPKTYIEEVLGVSLD